MEKADEFVPMDMCQKVRIEDAHWKQDQMNRLYDIQSIVRKQAGEKPPKKPDTKPPMLTIPIPLTNRDLVFVMDKRSALAFAMILGLSVGFIIVYTNL